MEKLLEFLLLNSVYASIVMFVVLLIRLLLCRAPKVFSYMLWAVVFLRLLCPVSLSSELSIIPDFSQLFTDDNAYETVLKNDDHTYNYGSSMISEVKELGNNTEATTAVMLSDYGLASSANRSDCSIDTLIFGVWLCGVLVISAIYGASWVRMKKKLPTATLIEGNIYESDRIGTAFTCGLIKPKIYVPCWLESEWYDCIVCHEGIHIRRGDHIIKQLAYIAAIIYWFNPAVWISLYLMCRDMEQSCDEVVIALLGEGVKGDYSRLLLDFSVSKPLSIGTAFGEHNAKRRITNVLRYKNAGAPQKVVSVAAVLLAAVVCIGCNTYDNSIIGKQLESNRNNVSRTDVQSTVPNVYEMNNEVFGSAADSSVLAELGEAQIVMTTQLEEGVRMNISWAADGDVYIDWGNGRIIRFVPADVTAGDTIKLYSTGNITGLYCNNNRLSDIDVSNCPALTIIDCSSNELSRLDLSSNIMIQKLDCSDNQLRKLDISENTELRTLVCSNNGLSELDISKNLALRILSCYSNYLNALDISRNSKLTELYCYDNLFEELDASCNPELTIVQL